MRNLFISIFLITSLLFITCEQKDNENNPEVPQSVIDKSLDYFDGEVIEKKLEEEEGVEAWEIKIQNSNGSVVKFYWTVNREILLKMEGLVGPFDYDINPESDLINFSTAQTIAIGAVKNNVLEKWVLKQEEDFIDKWIYSFEFNNDNETVKVYIDAEKGDILETD